MDYRTRTKEQAFQVDTVHFTPQVEMLISGQTAPIAADLHYTLSYFPNHHRALVSMTKLGERYKSPQPPLTAYSVECYFDRAVRFRPDDHIVRMLYAKYLFGQSRADDAIRQLQVADTQSADSGFSQYNIGLIYLEAGRHDKALEHAHKALALGFTRSGLKDSLVKAGKWVEPPAAPASSPESTASAPASAPISAPEPAASTASAAVGN